MNKVEFKAEMIRKNKNANALAASIGVSPATFYKKQNDETFTAKEIKVISEELGLSQFQIQAIFFS